MTLLEKLLDIQKSVDALVKDGKNTSDKYTYVSSELVLNTVRPKMVEHGLLLVPQVTEARLHEGITKSGTTRYMTELQMVFSWVDGESGEKLDVPWYAQGVDLAGEKGVGKAQTYAEKYFLLKFFHIETSKDDPDSDGRTGAGEKRQQGTQAAAETDKYQRAAITQMLDELCGGDADKMSVSLEMLSRPGKDKPGVDNVALISRAALPVVYGRAKQKYEAKTDKAFAFKTEEETGNG